MTLDNTRFSREHSAEENKAEGLRVKTAADIWQQKRGSDDEITRLFISMARAAGLKAWAMIVTERNRNLFNAGLSELGPAGRRGCHCGSGRERDVFRSGAAVLRVWKAALDAYRCHGVPAEREGSSAGTDAIGNVSGKLR